MYCMRQNAVVAGTMSISFRKADTVCQCNDAVRMRKPVVFSDMAL